MLVRAVPNQCNCVDAPTRTSSVLIIVLRSHKIQKQKTVVFNNNYTEILMRIHLEPYKPKSLHSMSELIETGEDRQLVRV